MTKNILLIGGNGFIGREIYKSLSQLHKVYVLDKKKINKNDTICDISDFSSLNKSLDKLLKTTEIDTIINCSYPRLKKNTKNPLLSDPKIILANYKMHFLGFFNITKYFIKYFLKKKIKGKIINFSSIYGSILPKFEIYNKNEILTPLEYGLIKQNIVYISKYFAKYVIGSGISINCISPGGVFDYQNKNFVKNYSKFTNFKRMMSKTDFNKIIEFLINSQPLKITGQNFIIDDGFSL